MEEVTSHLFVGDGEEHVVKVEVHAGEGGRFGEGTLEHLKYPDLKGTAVQERLLKISTRS